MSKGNIPIKYPVKEKAVAIVNTNNKPFSNVLIGITYPFADYFIDRGKGCTAHILEYVIEGEGEVLIDGAWKKVQQGDTYILLGGEEQKYRASKRNPYKKIWINYESEYLASFFEAYGVKSGVYRVNTLSYFETLVQLSEGAYSDVETSIAIADCVHKIISLAATCGTYQNEPLRIKERLDAAVYSKINLNAIAEEFHMSKSNLIRVFKKAYKQTPYEYLLSAKMETAKIFLCNTNMRITEISERLYITDQHYFSYLFTQRVGVTPTEFRRLESVEN